MEKCAVFWQDISTVFNFLWENKNRPEGNEVSTYKKPIQDMFFLILQLSAPSRSVLSECQVFVMSAYKKMCYLPAYSPGWVTSRTLHLSEMGVEFSWDFLS